MKKTILALAIVATGFATFGQGYFLFQTGTRQVWDTIQVSGTNAYKPDNGLDVAFLYAASGTPAISVLGASSATNGTTVIGSYAAAWSDILTNSGGFTLAQNAGSTTAIQQTSTVGGIGYTYQGQGTFAVPGTTAGSTYEVYVIAWSDAYATPSLAAAAGAAVGWSSVFSYASGANSSSSPYNFSDSPVTGDNMIPFGLATVVPEPSTIALAGMGIASLLAFRRRK